MGRGHVEFGGTDSLLRIRSALMNCGLNGYMYGARQEEGPAVHARQRDERNPRSCKHGPASPHDDRDDNQKHDDAGGLLRP